MKVNDPTPSKLTTGREGAESRSLRDEMDERTMAGTEDQAGGGATEARPGDDDLLRQIARDVAAAAERIERWRAENPEAARIQDVRTAHEIAQQLQAAAEDQAREGLSPSTLRYRG